jgi:negative regulator of sigma-B (phosphoserine phosphatase)
MGSRPDWRPGARSNSSRRATARIDGSRGLLTWLAVGNVHAVLVRARQTARTRPQSLVGVGGVVGRQIPSVREHQEAIEPGDLLVFATDGIRPDFADGLSASVAPERVAPAILAGHWTGGDDALVLAARYRGELE